MLQGEGRASLAGQPGEAVHPFAPLAKEPFLSAVEGLGFGTAPTPSDFDFHLCGANPLGTILFPQRSTQKIPDSCDEQP